MQAGRFPGQEGWEQGQFVGLAQGDPGFVSRHLSRRAQDSGEDWPCMSRRQGLGLVRDSYKQRMESRESVLGPEGTVQQLVSVTITTEMPFRLHGNYKILKPQFKPEDEK